MSISNTSAMQYARTYLFLIKKAGSENIDDIFQVIKTAQVKNNTRMAYLNAIIALKKQDPSLVHGDLTQLIQFRDEIQEYLEEEREANNANASQTAAMSQVNLEQLHQFVDKLAERKYDSIKKLENYLLIKLMVTYPLRNDLQDIALTWDKRDLTRDQNMLYIPVLPDEPAVLSLPHYKTSKTHGRVMIRLDPSLTPDIQLLSEDSRRYLFASDKGEPLSSSNFTHRLNKIFLKEFGVKISSTLIRKIYLTGKYGQILENMRQDAQLMGHNLQTQQNSYISNNPQILDLQ